MPQEMMETAAPRQAKADAQKRPHPSLSHNLLGQRLGRKGRITRERILAATERLLADPQGEPLSLSAVAREASLAMTSLYLYFADLTELILAVLEPIMASAEQSYIAQLRQRWPDETLGENCHSFVIAFHAFWQRHARILHLRNNAGIGNPRIFRQRVHSAIPVVELVAFQMDGDPTATGTAKVGMASALVTGIERVITVTTDAEIADLFCNARPDVPNLLRGQARLMELAILDGRGLTRR